MSLNSSVTLPCGLELPNRIAKAAMAENLLPKDHNNPGKLFEDAYSDWAKGEWGMILTGNIMVSEKFHGGPKDLAAAMPSHQTAAIEVSWKRYASAVNKHGSPILAQLNHPGRQSPIGAGSAGMFEKRVSASSVRLNLGNSLIAQFLTHLLFGTPRPLTAEEIRGPGGIVEQFVNASVLAKKSGFQGVELHGAHGYLLAQFLSPVTNKRNDDFGGSAANRARIIVEIIKAVRAATGPEFAIGLKLNSVDASQSESPDDTVEQVRLIVDAGIDFIEISGGTYENPRMTGAGHNDLREQQPSPSSTVGVKPSTLKREAYFLEFTRTLRQHFPDLVLMVTGGFRTRRGMREAVESGACNLVGIGRPATVYPHLPKDIILNKDIADDNASVVVRDPTPPLWMRLLPIKPLASGFSSVYYSWKIEEMAKGTHVVGRQ